MNSEFSKRKFKNFRISNKLFVSFTIALLLSCLLLVYAFYRVFMESSYLNIGIVSYLVLQIFVLDYYARKYLRIENEWNNLSLDEKEMYHRLFDNGIDFEENHLFEKAVKIYQSQYKDHDNFIIKIDNNTQDIQITPI